MAKSIKKHLYGRAGYRQAGGYGDAGKLLGTEAKRGRRVIIEGDGRISYGREGVVSHVEGLYERRDAAPSAGQAFVQGVGKFAKGVGAGAPVRPPKPFHHDVFASEAEYNQSVESVVARIKSGQVKARTPDKDD